MTLQTPVEPGAALESEPTSSSRTSTRCTSVPVPSADASLKGNVLLVDDEPTVRRALARVLSADGYAVTTASDGREAVALVEQHGFDVVVSDITMPSMDGIQLLREVRNHDLQVPVVLITGKPAVRTAVLALEYGAMHYLTKPVANDEIVKVLDRAVRLHRMARVRQEAAKLLGHGTHAADRAGLEASFDRAMASLWMAYQPIVHAADGSVFGYEALLRSTEPALPHPGAVIDAAERLGCLDLLGRSIREHAARPMPKASDAPMLFVNLHVTDLLDPSLSCPDAPLSAIADRVILEVTERASLDTVKDARERIATLREMGFRIAVDDMGAGYAGLSSFAALEPEIIKLDMSLIRDVHLSATKKRVVRSMTDLARDLDLLVVAEGIETVEERDVVVELGCDLLQGYLFAKPGRPFPEIHWP